MGMAFTLAKNLAAGSNAASVLIRTAKNPFTFQAQGGFAGTVTLENSTDWIDIADADAAWDSLGTIANNDALVLSAPISRVRIRGTHSSGTATVRMIEGDVPHP